jgi:hypothetical protein
MARLRLPTHKIPMEIPPLQQILQAVYQNVFRMTVVDTQIRRAIVGTGSASDQEMFHKLHQGPRGSGLAHIIKGILIHIASWETLVIIGNVQGVLVSVKCIASSKFPVHLLQAATNLFLGNTFMTVMLRYTVPGVTASSRGRKNWWTIGGVQCPVASEIHNLCKALMRNRESF